MDTSLESVLSEETSDTSTAETGATEQQAGTSAATGAEAAGASETAATGEHTAPPAEPRKDDQLDKQRRGFEAATLAERNRRQEAERRAEAAEARIRALEQPAKQQTQQQADTGKPLRGQFATEDEWLDARDAWRDQKAAEATREKQELSQRQEREQQVQRVADEIIGKGRQTHADFDDVINTGLGPVLDATKPADGSLPLLQQALLQNERGHEVAYFLAKNQADAWRIAALGPWQMARELTLIETKLDATTAGQAAERPAKPNVELPETLTQARDARGRFDKDPGYDGPTPLDAVLATKPK